jgi:uncharacterized protein (TIGR02452 family)
MGESKYNNARRAAIAQETVAALRAGEYLHQESGRAVDIATELRACVDGTVLLLPGDVRPPSDGCGDASCQIEVVEASSLAAARALCDADCNPVVLNFASARNPGGGFLGGAEAQEESIARASALYACLTESDGGKAFYGLSKRQRDPLYTDGAVYSPTVPILRVEEGSIPGCMTGRFLEEPWAVSFITAAAPNAGVARKRGISEQAIEDVYARRADHVLTIAADRGHDALVLGAWGCGVFRNEPRAAAAAFGKLLRGKHARAFRTVTFAILGNPANRAPFVNEFQPSGGRLSE